MNKVLSILPFILILLIGLSCNKKKDNIGFTGNVFEPNMQTNVSDVEVVLSAQLIESGTWNTNYTKLQSTNTDSEGKFSFDIESQKTSNYKISVYKDGYFDQAYIISPDAVDKGEVLDDTYNIFSESTIQIHLKNIYPLDSLDKIYFSIDGQTSSCTECCSTNERTYNGNNIDEIITCKLPGHQTIKIDYYVIRDGSTQIHQKSKWITEFATNNVDLFY